MSGDESFLHRWSRLKRSEVRRDAAAPDALAEPSQAANATAAPSEPESETPQSSEVESLPPLPPIDGLGARSDYTPFLSPDVPAELKRLALRKAWSSDPAIAEFRGMAEYDWDFNAPGYASLLPTDDIKQLCGNLFGDRRSNANRGEEPIEPAPKPAAEPILESDPASDLAPSRADVPPLPNTALAPETPMAEASTSVNTPAMTDTSRLETR